MSDSGIILLMIALFFCGLVLGYIIGCTSDD